MNKKSGWWGKCTAPRHSTVRNKTIGQNINKAVFLLFRRNSGDGGNEEERHTNYARLGPVGAEDVKEGQKQENK